MTLPIEAPIGWFTCSARRGAGDHPQGQAAGSLHPPMRADWRLAVPCADTMKHGLGTPGRLGRWPAGSTSMKPQPQFLRIQWEDIPEPGAPVTLTATLCLRHRGEIALAYASARGSGELGDACDLCEGRTPRPLE
jgi:hypothetical protein